MENIKSAIAYLSTLPAYTLADMAAVSAPNTDSEGGRFLTLTRDSLVEWLDQAAEQWTGEDDVDEFRSAMQDYGNDDGTLSEIQDEAPSVYNSTRIQQLVDLAAWNEDTTELGTFDTITEAVGAALYIVAGRLITGLLDCLHED